jgi:hypothetical protein
MEISPVTQANATAVPSKTDVKPVTKDATNSKPQPTFTDTVQISSAATAAAKAALQELTETPYQTDQEARKGDLQAKRLQAREAAAEEALEAPSARAQEAQGLQGAQAASVTNLR